MGEAGIGARVLGKAFSRNDILTELKDVEFRRRKQFLAAGTQYVSPPIWMGWKVLEGK